MKTLRRSLLKTLFLGSLVTLFFLGLLVHFAVRFEVQELLDFQIEQVALSTLGGKFPLGERSESNFEEEPDLVIQIWGPDGKTIHGFKEGNLPPRVSSRGFGWSADRAWRNFAYPDGERWVQVSQSMRERRMAALLVTLSLMGPILLFMIPVLAVVVTLSVRKGLRPLGEMAERLRARAPHSLTALPEEGLPGEILPLVQELNGLLERLSGALESKHLFLAHAAHELRTPVTAVRLQAQLAMRATDSKERNAALADMEGGIRRVSHLLDQLLTYARLDPENEEQPLRPLPLGPLVREAMTLLLPLSRERDIDLGLARDDAVTITGDPRDLLTMITNLIDNAVRYTPRGGKVDVSLQHLEEEDRLEIVDSGPGIPAGEREKIFDRFYRGRQRDVHGSGLGLSIVRQIAQRHDFLIELGDAPEGTGLKVTLKFPR